MVNKCFKVQHVSLPEPACSIRFCPETMDSADNPRGTNYDDDDDHVESCAVLGRGAASVFLKSQMIPPTNPFGAFIPSLESCQNPQFSSLFQWHPSHIAYTVCTLVESCRLPPRIRIWSRHWMHLLASPQTSSIHRRKHTSPSRAWSSFSPSPLPWSSSEYTPDTSLTDGCGGMIVRPHHGYENPEREDRECLTIDQTHRWLLGWVVSHWRWWKRRSILNCHQIGQWGFAGILLESLMYGNGVDMWNVSVPHAAHFNKVRHLMGWMKANAEKWWQLFSDIEIVARISMFFTKLSILLLFIRIFVPLQTQRTKVFYAIWFVISFNFFYCVALVLTILLQCVGKKDKSKSTCIDTFSLLIMASTINVLSDLVMLIIPLSSVWKLHMSRKLFPKLTFAKVWKPFGVICKKFYCVDLSLFTWGNSVPRHFRI